MAKEREKPQSSEENGGEKFVLWRLQSALVDQRGKSQSEFVVREEIPVTSVSNIFNPRWSTKTARVEPLIQIVAKSEDGRTFYGNCFTATNVSKAHTNWYCKEEEELKVERLKRKTWISDEFSILHPDRKEGEEYIWMKIVDSKEARAKPGITYMNPDGTPMPHPQE